MNKKYELVEHKSPHSAENKAKYYIVALRDIPEVGVEKGDHGGYIDGEHNLEQVGNCWVESTGCYVEGKACVYGNALITGSANVRDNAQVFGNAIVTDDASVSGYACVYENAKLGGYAKVGGRARVCGNAVVTEDARVRGNAIVFGNAVICDTACVDGIAVVPGGEVDGLTRLPEYTLSNLLTV